MIEIVDYRDTWPDAFGRIRSVLQHVCPSALVIHHIGSTAVAGLPAKDVIDVQVTVADLESVDAGAFEREGFLHRPGLVDHTPAGLHLAAAECAKLFFKYAARPAHVHVREAGRHNQRYALLCRDYLRSHSGAAEAYGLVKRRLAALFHDDEDVYYDIKDPVCDLIMEGADEWAARTSWQLPPGD